MRSNNGKNGHFSLIATEKRSSRGFYLNDPNAQQAGACNALCSKAGIGAKVGDHPSTEILKDWATIRKELYNNVKVFGAYTTYHLPARFAAGQPSVTKRADVQETVN